MKNLKINNPDPLFPFTLLSLQYVRTIIGHLFPPKTVWLNSRILFFMFSSGFLR